MALNAKYLHVHFIHSLQNVISVECSMKKYDDWKNIICMSVHDLGISCSESTSVLIRIPNIGIFNADDALSSFSVI